MSGHARTHGHAPRRQREVGRDTLRLLAQLDAERNPARCGVCEQPSQAPLCRGCAALVRRERA